jgi:UDP-glucose 4-epimerase
MKSKMAITGGGGFCGTHLADHFVERYQITLFDNFERNALRFAPHLRRNADVDVIPGDVLDRDALGTAFAHASTVIHLAAIAGVSNY